MRHTSRATEFAAGVRAELPLLLGVAPFGMAYGAYAIETGLSAPLVQAMSSIIFGGASQLVAVQAFAAGTPALVVVLTVALVNLRHMLYSASLAPNLQGLERGWRAMIAYLLTDEAYAVGITRYSDDERTRYAHWFLLGAGVALWICWQITTAIGVLVGEAVPASWSLEFALPVTFIAILVPALDGAGPLTAVAVAGGVAVAGNDWPYETGLIAAALGGMAGGLLAQRLTAARSGDAGPAGTA